MQQQHKFKVNGVFVYKEVDNFTHNDYTEFNDQVAIALMNLMIKHNLNNCTMDNLLIDKYY